MRERWRVVEGWPTYIVSDQGRVIGPKGEKSQTPCKDQDYVYVSLEHRGVRRVVRVHTLVLEAFKGPCPEGMEAAHLNGNGKDNRLNNLTYKTHLDNIADKVRHGTDPIGERNGSSVLKEWQVRVIKGSDLLAVETALCFGISVATVRLIRAGKIWAHVQ